MPRDPSSQARPETRGVSAEPPGTVAPGSDITQASRLTVQEDQDELLAWELAAFPAEDEPVWEDLEYLDYLDYHDDTGPSIEETWPTDLPGPLPSDYPASPTDRAAAAPGADGTAPGPGAAAAASTTCPSSTGPSTTGPSTTGPATAGAGSGGAGAGFAEGGAADVMPPGPVLARLADRVWQDGLDGLDDDELTGVMQAANRLGAWAAALKLSAVCNLLARRETAARADGDWRPFEHADDEVAVALTLTRWSAGNLLGLAVALDRLPLTRAALAAGQIDERRAAVITDELSGLEDEHAAAVEAAIIGDAPRQTTSELRAAARRAVIAADPAAAKRRKDKALKDARVQAFTEPAGTAGLSGRDLPPAEVLAADKNLTALADAMKKAGAEGTMDLLRARAYLHLLSGQPAESLLARMSADTGTPGTANPGTGTSGSLRTGNPGTAGTPGAGTTRTDTTSADTTGSAMPGNETAGGGDCGTGPASTATSGSGAAGLGLPALRGSVNLTMPLATWLGWSQSPGQVPGFGPLDADDSRELADLLTGHPANQWCITLTDPAGRPVAHGCATTGPGPFTRPNPGPSPSPGTGPSPPADPHDPGSNEPGGGDPGGSPPRGSPRNPGGGSESGGGGSGGGPPRAGPQPGTGSAPGTSTGPPSAPGWIRGLTITPLQTRDCTHPRETQAYQIGPALRHLIQIRQATCSRPGCRRAATRCDMDHTIPYHLGGRSCECNIAPICRHDHATKQTPGWTLTQNQPGTMTWTTPGNRTYTTTPTCYPA